jgi:hypothetical protein
MLSLNGGSAATASVQGVVATRSNRDTSLGGRFGSAMCDGRAAPQLRRARRGRDATVREHVRFFLVGPNVNSCGDAR